jgi:uncharacterized phage protein (TIGR02216 family)
MRFGLGRLRLSPDHFWSMTPAELAAAARAYAPPEQAPMDRLALLDLLKRFPDGKDDIHG